MKTIKVALAGAGAFGIAQVTTSLADGLVAMLGRTRRFNAGHQWVHQKIQAREFNVQQLDAAG